MIRLPALGAGLAALLSSAPAPALPAEATVQNPLLAPWTGPHGGVPPFDTPQFFHAFGGDSYSAGYDSYLWSDTLAADACEAFMEAGGPYDKAVAKRLRECVLSVGNTIDPAEAYRAFRGRDPQIRALMLKRGFPAAADAATAQ